MEKDFPELTSTNLPTTSNELHSVENPEENTNLINTAPSNLNIDAINIGSNKSNIDD